MTFHQVCSVCHPRWLLIFLGVIHPSGIALPIPASAIIERGREEGNKRNR